MKLNHRKWANFKGSIRKIKNQGEIQGKDP